VYIVGTDTNEKIDVEIAQVDDQDYHKLTIKRYFFNWKEEENFNVYKLVIKGQDDILGLISLDFIDSESRVEIRLLAVAIENRGRNKKYDRIAGCLIGFAARKAITEYSNFPCISLIPKTELREHYKETYYMIDGGISVFSDGFNLLKLSMEYE